VAVFLVTAACTPTPPDGYPSRYSGTIYLSVDADTGETFEWTGGSSVEIRTLEGRDAWEIQLGSCVVELEPDGEGADDYGRVFLLIPDGTTCEVEGPSAERMDVTWTTSGITWRRDFLLLVPQGEASWVEGDTVRTGWITLFFEGFPSPDE